MFTGIIESTGIVKDIASTGSNRTFWIESPLAGDLKVDQSVSHNGICLTVEEIKKTMHRITAIDETLVKTNAGFWETGTKVNLERCIQLNGRLDGHIVQGHVDCTAECTGIINKEGSREFSFRFDKKFAAFVIEKGSITVNGISLTCFNVDADRFTVAIIPYTYTHTNMSSVKEGASVNIEWDMIGKYVNRMMNVKA